MRHYLALLALPALLLPLPALAEPELVCRRPAQADCLLESAEEHLDEVNDPLKAGPAWLDVNKGYTYLKQPTLAWSAARHLQQPAAMAEAIARVAALYRAAGEQQRAGLQIQQGLEKIQPYTCTERLLPEFRLGLAAGLTGLYDQWDRLTPATRQVVTALTGEHLAERGEIAASEPLLATLTDPYWHDRVWVRLASAKAPRLDDAGIEKLLERFRTPEARTDFLTLHLPMALLKDEQDTRAIARAHSLTDLTAKANIFRRMGAEYQERGETMRAMQALEFAREFGRKIEEGYDSSSALRFTGEVYLKLGEMGAARLAFEDALRAAMRISILERQLSAVIGLVEIQGKQGDIKGARLSFFGAVEGGLLQRIDASGQSGELGRLLSNLDGKLSHNDRARLMELLLEMKSPPVRSKMLYQISLLTASPRIESGRSEELFERVRKKLRQDFDSIQVLKLETMLAGIQFELGQKEAALKEFADVRSRISYLVMESMPAAALKEAVSDLKLFLAREEARVGERMMAIKDYRSAGKVKMASRMPLAQELLKHADWVALEEVLPPDAVISLAAEQEKMEGLVAHIKSFGEDKRGTWLRTGWETLTERKLWPAAGRLLPLIEKFDEEQWRDGNKIIADPDQKTQNILVEIALAQRDWDSAYPAIRRIGDPLARALSISRLARLKAEQQPEAEWGVTKADLTWLMQPLPARFSAKACQTAP